MEDGPLPGDWILLGFCCLVGPLALGIARLVLPVRRKVRQPTSASIPLANPSDQSRAVECRAVEQSIEASDVERSSVSPKGNGSVENHDFLSTTQNPSELGSSEGNGETRRVSKSERIVYYDFWRTLCICLVVITHCNEVYVEWNVLATQNWVLPFFSIISGALFAKASKSPLIGYIARLLMLFSVGAALNGGAAILTRVHWWGSEFAIVVLFQIAFVMLFAGGAIVSRPLKAQFDNPDNQKIAILNTCLYKSVVLGALIFLQFMPTSPLAQTIRVTAECFTTALIAALGMWILPTSRRGLLGWIILAWIFGTRVLHKEPRPGSEFHYVDLYIWAFVVENVPLAGQVRVGQILQQTWPVWAVGIALLMVPGSHGRKDQEPFSDMVDRARFYVPEIIFVIAFTAIPKAGQGAMQFSENIARHMTWLNLWSLFAFLTHKAIYYLVDPHRYLGFCFIFATMPIFYLRFGPKAREDACPAGLVQNLPTAELEDGLPSKTCTTEAPFLSVN